MKRTTWLAGSAAVALVALVLAGSALRRDREFRRLIALGDDSVAAGETFVAAERFSGALALRPNSMIAYLKRGETYQRRGDLTAALRDLRSATLLDATATHPLELLGDVNATMGRYDRAVSHYQRFVRLDDRSPRVLYKLGLIHFQHGYPLRAIGPLQQAVAIDSRLASAHHLLGLCFRELGRDNDALSSLNEAITLDPTLEAARSTLVELLEAQGNASEGLTHLRVLAETEPMNAERLVSVGLLYARLGYLDQALVTLRRAAGHYRDHPGVHTAIGRVWLDEAEGGDDAAAVRKAMEALQPVAARPTASGETLGLYGRTLLLSGNAAEAVRVLRQAAERLPVDRSTLVALEAAAEKVGELAVARDAMVSRVTLNDEDDADGGLSARIAQVSLRIEDPATAVVWARRAARGGESGASRRVLLADALWQAGRHAAAREIIDEVLEATPGHPEAQRRRRRFRSS